jgi:uncharacterized membrane protein YjgN (DUF898 family)
MNEVVTPPAIPEQQTHDFQFTGSGGEYFKIWIVNIILSVLTLGIYSAWAKVRNKRYFYGNTILDENSFEYDADPVKILKGRIIVGVFFVALNLSQQSLPLIYWILFLIFIGFLPWLVVRALMFNARYSSYRNIRFSFNGLLKESYLTYLLFPFLSYITAGILFPYTNWRQQKFYGDGHRFGKKNFSFAGAVKDFYILYLALLGIVIIIGALLALNIAFLSGVGAFAILLMYVLFFLSYIFIGAYFKVRLTNIMWNNLSLGDHRFSSTLQLQSVYSIYLTNFLMIALTLGLAVPWAKVRMARYRAQCMTFITNGSISVESDPDLTDEGASGDAAADFADFDFGF